MNKEGRGGEREVERCKRKGGGSKMLPSLKL